MALKDLLDIRNPFNRIVYSSVPVLTAAGVALAQEMTKSPEASAASILGIAAVAIAPIASVAGNSLAEAISNKFFNRHKREDILKNGDLEKAVGDAICATILSIDKTLHPDANARLLKKLSKVPAETWQELVSALEEEKDTFQNLSIEEIDTLLPKNMPDIFAIPAKQFNDAAGLNAKVWEKILRKLCALQGISISNEANQNSTDTITLAAETLEKDFRNILKHTIISNPDGKAYANLQLKIIGEVLYLARETHGISQETLSNTKEILKKINDLEQRNEQIIAINSLLEANGGKPDDAFWKRAFDLQTNIFENTEELLIRTGRIEEHLKKMFAKLESLAEAVKSFSVAQSAPSEMRERKDRDAENYRRENQRRESIEARLKLIPNPIPGAHDVFDRRDECANLMEMLTAEDTRLVRIVAPSGYGKTKLVFKFLKSVEPQIGKGNDASPVDGVLLVSCKDRVSADVWVEMLDRAGLMTGRREEFNQEIRGIQSAEGQAAHLLNALEAAGRFWLVLDNFEDLLDVEHRTIGKDTDDPIKHLFHLLCANAVNQRLIITTQHVPVFVGRNAPLLSPIHLIEVGGTPETDAVNYLRTEGATYLLDRINEAALLDFVRRVERLPLALVSLLRDLEKHFESKPKGRVTVADVEAIAASATHYIEADKENGLRLWLTEQITELHPDERVILSVLSVFTKFCPQIALEFILPNFTTERIERLLARLERDKLIYQEDAGFQLSAIIRDAAYGLIPDAVDAGNNISVNEQIDFNKRTLHAQAANFYATQRKPQAEWKSIADVQAQLDEIQHRVSAGEFETAANVLFKIDFDYLLLWGNYRLILELRRQLEDNLPADGFAVAAQANSFGLVHLYMGQFRESIRQFEKLLQIAQSGGDKKTEGASLGSLGNAYDSLGDYRKAIEFYEQWLEISREIGNRSGEGSSLGNLGNAYHRLGDYRKAIEYHEQSLAISREIGDRLGEGNSLGNLGNAYDSLGESEKACGLWKEAVTILEAIESPNADIFRGNIEKFCGE